MANKLIKHLKIIGTHRKYVRQSCSELGIRWRGLVHDLSKYSITELKIYKYYTGKGSPHEEARQQLGYSSSWLHHYHKNTHHWEYWLDFSEDGKPFGIKMPYKDVIEIIADFIGAGKAYNNNAVNWDTTEPLDYWYSHCEGKRIMHRESRNLLVWLLNKLALSTESGFYTWYRANKRKIEQCYNDGGYKD